MEVMENLQVVWDLSDLYCLCSALVHAVFFLNIIYLLSQCNRELEGCAMGSCEKYITVAQPLILEALKTQLKITKQQDLKAVK